jgi:glycosyl transferase family 25
MVVTDYFDKTYCINLDHRTEKWESVQMEFDTHGLNVNRFSATDGTKIFHGGILKDGALGCTLSHNNIVQSAKNIGLNSVLILEDDVVFDDELNEKFVEWIKEVPEDWDMLYFGGNHNVGVTEKFTPHLIKITNTYTTHAYALKETVYDLILKRFKNMNFIVDVIYAEIQKQCNAYCFSPRLAWQKAGYSDILNVHADYSFLKDNDGKK